MLLRRYFDFWNRSVFPNVQKNGNKEIQLMKSAIIIQTRLRGVQARLKTQKMQYNIRLLAATIMIQKYMRMAQAKLLVAKMKKKKLTQYYLKLVSIQAKERHANGAL